MVQQPLLFAIYVDVKARVFGVQINAGQSGNGPRLREHLDIDVGISVPRVGVIDNEAGHMLSGLCAFRRV